MYPVLSERSEEFTRIRATLGPATQELTTRHELNEFLDQNLDTRVLVIAPAVKSELAFEFAAELRLQRPELNVILIRNHLDVPTLSAALESGIKDVLDSQDATGLMSAIQRCEKIAERLKSRNTSIPLAKARGMVVTVFAAKGGCGKTTIASNLAAALAERADVKICLVDLDLEFGDIATVLQLNPLRTISQALEMSDSVDSEGLVKVLSNYQSSFDVLLAPTNPDDISRITPQFTSRVIDVLRRNYDFVIIDTAPTLSPLMRQTLQESDLAILLTNLDMPAIKNLKITLSILSDIGIASERRILVLNKAEGKVGIEPTDIAELVGEQITISVPANSRVAASINEGRTIVDAHRHNPVSKAIFELAELVAAR